MKPFLSTIAIVLCSISTLGCGSPPAETGTVTQPQPAASSQIPSTPSSNQTPLSTAKPSVPSPTPVTSQSPAEAVADLEPEVGTIKELQQGDLMCYITFTDSTGTKRNTGATFDVCGQKQYLNQSVRLIYGVRTVNDCTSNEPCGKTRRTNLVIKLDPVSDSGQKPSTDSTVLRNRDWTITIDNRNAWSGVNGTGNLTYRGCQGSQCIDLSGGTMTCRDGVCSASWKNGDYTYTLASPITEAAKGAESTLTVRRNGTVLQKITGLR